MNLEQDSKLMLVEAHNSYCNHHFPLTFPFLRAETSVLNPVGLLRQTREGRATSDLPQSQSSQTGPQAVARQHYPCRSRKWSRTEH